MKPISSTETPPLKMKVINGEASEKFRVPASKIGWLHSIADKPGASFDIVFRDAMGREMFREGNCKTETAEFGKFVGLDTRLGEELQVTLENVKGADEVNLFLN